MLTSDSDSVGRWSGRSTIEWYLYHFQPFEVLSASINILKAFLYSLLKYHISKLQNFNSRHIKFALSNRIVLYLCT